MIVRVRMRGVELTFVNREALFGKFDKGRHAEAAARAKRGETQLDIEPPHFVEKGDDDSRARGGPNPARQILHGAGIPFDKPSFTVNMACASGMKKIALGVESILFGRSSCVVVGERAWASWPSSTRAGSTFERWQTNRFQPGPTKSSGMGAIHKEKSLPRVSTSASSFMATSNSAAKWF